MTFFLFLLSWAINKIFTRKGLPMQFSRWRKARLHQEPTSAVSALPLPKLLQLYKSEHDYLQSLGKHRDEFLTDADYKRIGFIEAQLQELLPDPLQYLVTQECVLHGMHPDNFVDPNHWRTALQETVRAIVHFLHYGEPYPVVSEPPRLYFPGDVFLLWLLQEAKAGTAGDAKANMAAALEQVVTSGSILGRPFTPKTANDFGGRIILLFYGDYTEGLSMLIAIYSASEAGEQLIREIVGCYKLAPIP